MSTITVEAAEKNGGYLKMSPARRAKASNFGLLDATIIVVFLLGTASLIYLLLLG
jgi:hypothetical protein